MLRHQAFKFELMPNGEQTRRMNQFCGCSRFVFNYGLDWQIRNMRKIIALRLVIRKSQNYSLNGKRHFLGSKIVTAKCCNKV